MIVAAKRGYPNYLSSSAYICQPNRSIRAVTYLGFYTHKKIEPQIAKVLERHSEVVFTGREASARESNGDGLGERLAEVIRWLLVHEPESVGSSHDVFLLSGARDEATVQLDAPIKHVDRGGWLQKQRYTNLDRLIAAATTRDL